MYSTDTLIIGAGQAGLSLSTHLARAGHRHAVLERGRIGERWRSERWDSLTLLTPNWLNRLDGGAPHPDPDGFLGRAAFADYLQRYARAAGAPVHEHVTVRAVEQSAPGFRIDTDAGSWRAHNVVIATGDAADPFIPAAAASAPRHLLQIHSNRYRNPAALRDGGVLVVGAGPSGQQIAAELQRAGRRVVLAAGRHARVMRRYRGRDIWHWLKEIGDLDCTIDEVPDPAAARRTPSFTLTGASGGEQLDLAVLRGLGIAVAGRLERFTSAHAVFSQDLQANVSDADRRMHRLLDRIDEHIEQSEAGPSPHEPDRVPDMQVPPGPASIDLPANRISTVIWATGYRREYPWLHVPVLDSDGEIVHRRGITPVPGLYVLGLKFQRRRASHFIGGVGADAALIAKHVLVRSRGSRYVRRACHARSRRPLHPAARP
jgi:putative flavoprotein involved in K+ transport